jgi:cysteinyl-tRNA synthetase
VRLFLLSTHYRGPIDFTHEQLDLYTKSLEGLRKTVELADGALAKNKAEGAGIKKLVKHLVKNFEDAMDDDFTTTNALAALYELSSLINNSLDQTSAGELKYALSKYKKLAGVLGLKLKPKKAKTGKIQMDDSSRKFFSEMAGGEKSGELSIAKELTEELIGYLVQLRTEFRKKGDYKKSDELRAKLSAMGIVIEDTADGVKWKRA